MEEQTPKKFHFTKQMKIGLAVVLVLCIGCGLIYLDTAYGSGKIRSLFVKSSVTQNKGNPSAGVLAEIPLDAGSSTSFAVFDQAFLLCTKDGAKYYNSVGDQKWNDTFTMTTPTVIQEGSFMAVGELGGKNVRVYDESGLLYNVQLEGNLSQFALNQNGYLSLLEKKDSGYEVKIYNSKGTLLKGRVEETAGVYPISTDVSDDNKSFAVSYVDTTDVYPIGRVLFFYVNPEDSENYTDSLYASAADKADEIIGTISYRSNGVLAAVSDKGVYGFRDSEEVWSYHLTNVVDYVSFQQKDRVVLTLGDALPGEEGKEEGTICWLGANGAEEASYVSGKDITYLSAWKDGIVVGTDHTYIGIRHTGREAWTYQATQDVTDVIPMESFSRVLVVGQDMARILDMDKYKGEAPADTTVTIKDGTKGIAGYAFYMQGNVTEVVIPNSVNNIGEVAFMGCESLKTVTIPESVKVIGREALGYLSSKQYEQGYKVEGFTIRGVAGSAAEKYAKENGFTFEAMKPDYIKGDSDSDGKVTISDVRTTLRYVCQKVELDEEQKLAADVEKDGVINIKDLRKVLRFVCNKIEEL